MCDDWLSVGLARRVAVPVRRLADGITVRHERKPRLAPRRDSEAWSVHAGRKGNLAKEGVRESASGGQPVVEGRRAQKLTGQLSERRVAGGQESQGIDRRREPQASDAKERRHALFEEQLQEILRRVGSVAQVLDLAQPM